MTQPTIPLVLVLDFDGTVAVGDAPVWAYADAVIDQLAGHDDPAAPPAAIRAALSAFLAGAPDSPAYLDGYAAVAAITEHYVTAEQRQRAYRASRDTLAGGTLHLSAPPGLAELLSDLAGRARRVVATNAPATGVRDTLGAIGLRGLIDEIITDAHKPGGWDTILPQLLAGRAPADLLAVGDVWANDIAAPLALGCCTALVDRFGRLPGPAHIIAPSLADMYDDIRAWATDPRAFARLHPARPTQPHFAGRTENP